MDIMTLVYYGAVAGLAFVAWVLAKEFLDL
jgi:hypothetical protein